ncbi:MAG: OmpA family protein [bacterium]
MRPDKTIVRAALLLALAALAAPAAAQEPYDLDIQNFRPAMDARSFITVERAKALGTLEPSFGLIINYAVDPLVQRIEGPDYDRDVPLVQHHLAGDFIFAIGIAHVVEIGARLPVAIIRGDGDGPGDGPELAGDGFGDIAANLKVAILDREAHPLGLALVASAAFDTGDDDVFASHGQGSPILEGGLVLDFQLGPRVGLAVNGGARLREERRLDGGITDTFEDEAGNEQTRTFRRVDPIVTGDEITYGLGVGVTLIMDRLDLVFETFGAVPLISEAERATPLETLLALRVFLVGTSFFTIGASRGWLQAVGDPNVRLFAGIMFEPSVGDRDGDGIPDDVDVCPDEAEDKDGFEDQDGCPDRDNDQDGIPDIIDQCPDLAEDKNGFEDDDGCPDSKRDRDGDGIIDHLDRCPDEPEDKDGFQDEDGCPDPDNDLDGIPDERDRCPLDPEDIDGFQDEDGCPDPDNDDDGILDLDDACPNDPENYNGVEDEDGCPEKQRKVVITGGKLEILEKVYFETNKAVIKTESYAILYEVADTLRQNPQIEYVEVQGHTDSRGAADYNLDLSQKRAAAVRQFLIDEGNIAPDRLDSRGYGESQPVDPSENEVAWAKNRRVEFIIKRESPR